MARPIGEGESKVPEYPRVLETLAGEPQDKTYFIGQTLSKNPVKPRVSIVIPTLNEAANLPYVLARLPEDVYEVIVVDGHSTDNTVEVAQELRNDVHVVFQTRRGKGNALVCGFAACRGDIIVMLDADGSTDPAEIPFYVAELLKGADVAKGSRFIPGGGSADITRTRALGNRVLTGMVNLMYGTRYSDLCYGYNAFWTRCLPYLNVDRDGFEVETLINIRVAKAGLSVVEVPSYEENRIHGVSNLRAFRDGKRVLNTILGERLRRHAPNQVWVSHARTEPTTWNGVDRRSPSERGQKTDGKFAELQPSSYRRSTDRTMPVLLPSVDGVLQRPPALCS